MYNVEDVASYVLFYVWKRGHVVSVLQLMKMLYFVQANFLVVQKKPAFKEKIIAKEYGPVQKEIWNKYLVYGNAFIPVLDKKEPRIMSNEDKQCTMDIVESMLGYGNNALYEIIKNQKPYKKGLNNAPECEITNAMLLEFFE